MTVEWVALTVLVVLWAGVVVWEWRMDVRDDRRHRALVESFPELVANVEAMRAVERAAEGDG